MAMANDMTLLLNKIERRLGLLPLIPHLPEFAKKDKWADIISLPKLKASLYSIPFPDTIASSVEVSPTSISITVLSLSLCVYKVLHFAYNELK